MASVKLASTVVFLATILMFPMTKIEACENFWCTIFNGYHCSSGCGCIAAAGLAGFCRPQLTITKAVEEHPNLCQSHHDCIKKGTGSLCAYYPNSELQHGWCFTSNVEAEQYFEVLSNLAINKFLKNIFYSNGKGFLKMPVEIAT